MNTPKGYVLKDWQTPRPVIWQATVPLPPSGYFQKSKASIELLQQALGGGASQRLQTFARKEGDYDGPHWIGVRNGTPLHVDPRYPRYTHQIVVYNDGWSVSGATKELPPEPHVVGTAFCADTHSPHILLPDARVGKGVFYLAASMDSKTPIPQAEAIQKLLEFLAPFSK